MKAKEAETAAVLAKTSCERVSREEVKEQKGVTAIGVSIRDQLGPSQQSAGQADPEKT